MADVLAIEQYESLLNECNREGMDRLMNYIKKSDFYTAPASTRFHSCHEGGLLEHSLNVFACLRAMKNSPVWQDALKDVTDDSLVITSLLHDICKANYYAVEFRNKKIYKEDGKKSDSNGRFDWESVPSYIVDDKMPIGHGEKSAMIAMSYIRLKPMEMYAIRWHMGFTEPKENWNTFTSAIKKYPLVLALHMADLEATYLMEKEE